MNKMLFDKEGNIDKYEARDIIESVVQEGDIGLFSWHMNPTSFELTEHISGHDFPKLHSLPDFLEKYVFPKDQEIAFQDLNNYLDGTKKMYQSTFRILDNNDNIKWVFCRGALTHNNKLSGIIYEVTGNKIMKGNDFITNLIDAKYFTRKLENAIDNCQKNSCKGALLYLEIDNFRSIINNYGFEFGSLILYKMSRLLLTFTGDSDELSRFPNDKFMMLIDDIKDAAEIKELSHTIIEALERPFIIAGTQVYLNASIGITLFPEASHDAIELIRQSEFAISHSRLQGGNRASLFESELMETFNRSMKIEGELANALINKEMHLVYQPQLNVVTNRITGFEVLLRWNNKKLGVVSPADFIPVAEEKGFIVKIGKWLIQETLQTARKWLDLGFEFGTLSVNISPVELVQKNFRKTLLESCLLYDVPPERIKIEITERTVMASNAENVTIINKLIADGFKIALDDFGVGYSNFNFLFEFEITTLKLDKSLIDNIADEKRRFFIESLIKLRQFKEFDVIAEGVETKEELDLLMELGCQRIQGYLFSRPLKQVAAENFLVDFIKASE